MYHWCLDAQVCRLGPRLHQQQHHEPISVAMLVQVVVVDSNLKLRGMLPTNIIWQVREDRLGRWRDFPLDLQNQVETEWQKWQEGGAADEVVVHYVWPNAKGDRYRTYEITFLPPGPWCRRTSTQVMSERCAGPCARIEQNPIPWRGK